jgi:4-amino-4-deoxy-L-arabinose transferase-like glycosyltransferase
MNSLSNRWAKWAAVLLLWLIFAQAALAAARTSITIDEGLHITSGYSILRTGDYRLIEEHPPLVKLIMALPLLPVPDLPDVRTLPGWQADVSVLDSVRLVRAAQKLIYPYQPIDRLVFAARIPIALLAVLLGAILWRWTKDLAGWSGGVLALFLLAFDPNLLAHASVAGTDLGAACFITLALFTFWRFIRRPTLGRMALAGITLGLAQAAKLTGLLLLPIEALIVAWVLLREKSKSLVLLQLGIFLIAALTLWAVYGFEIGRVPGVPFPVPAASHAIPWLRLQQHIAGGHAAFLLGEVFDRGRWTYFPVAFALKTPLPTLVLLFITLVLAVGQMPRAGRPRAGNDDGLRAALTVGLFPLAYFVSSMVNPLNIGYRHLLPMLPFIFIFIGALVSKLELQISNSKSCLVTSAPRLLVVVLLTWNVLGTVRLFPHYLAYFNETVGGPDAGWRYLADSNTDWGQALKDLAAYQRDHHIEQVRLSMFTFMDPAIYGVHYEPLTPIGGNTPAVFPSRFNPPPGDYVISATTLDGIPLADPEMFDWFRQREPDARIGHVMFLYRVRLHDPRTWLAQCTTPVAPLEPPQISEGFGRSDLRVAYFDCSTSWLYPMGGRSPGWFALAREATLGDTRWLTGTRLAYEQKRGGFSPPFRIYEGDGHAPVPQGGAVHVAPSDMALPEALMRSTADLPLTFENGLTLLGYTLDPTSFKPGETAHLETVWRVDRVPNRLLSVMAHALGPDGRVMAVGDGLGVPIESWQPGDIFIQRHTLTLPKDAPPGSYWMQTGVYWLDDGQRWPVRDARASGDRAILVSFGVR